jgi:molybdopterin-guanine dinucleotide biosynthesis protein A
MGRDKALLMLEGRTLVERALGKLESVCSSTAIAGGGSDLAGFGRMVTDGVPGCGPLGGIVAALESSEFDWSIFLPVDVPLVSVELVRGLAERCVGSEAVAVLVRVHGRVEPLCGGYSRRALPGLREALGAGRLKVTAGVEGAGVVEYFDVEDGDQFANLNTPEEFTEAERRLMGGGLRSF